MLARFQSTKLISRSHSALCLPALNLTTFGADLSKAAKERPASEGGLSRTQKKPGEAFSRLWWIQ